MSAAAASEPKTQELRSSGSIQIEQQSDECQSLMPRKLNDFLGDFFDAGGQQGLSP
jgi:hypothetical protein